MVPEPPRYIGTMIMLHDKKRDTFTHITCKFSDDRPQFNNSTDV